MATAADEVTSEQPTTFDGVIAKIARVDSQPVLVSGQTLGETYELLERLGGGGMGVVFRARDRRLGRDVAVKVLRASGAEDHVRALFEREARATAQLLHPNIVTLHHVGEQDGQPYLVLELLVGETLSTRLARRGALAIAEAAAIADGVLAALAFAHERGVLHRDLKPNNVFVTVDERVKVLDFGVALTLDTNPGPITRFAGTPGYMAPEHRDGGAQDVRTDVWAAAQLVLECLLGRRPQEAESTSVIAELAVPRQVRTVLERALATDPDQRPATARELRTQLAHATAPARVHRKLSWRSTIVIAAVAVAIGVWTVVLARRVHAPAPVTAAEINGHTWHVNFGELRMHIDADGTAYGVFDHQDGIQTGAFKDGHWSGWWCQLPSRKPPDDAGTLELHFVRGDDRILIEGEYKYGDGREAEWRKDFYGVEIADPTSFALEQRLQHHEPCPK
ncbi:MAG: serine/threonine-protein kinase [Kofleriaceae bacterium]